MVNVGRYVRTRPKWFWWTLVTITVLLVGFRLALPGLVKDYVNNKLDELPEYDGSIADVDIHLLRGAYSIDGVNIVKTTGEVPVPFFEARKVDFSVQWKELFNGSIVSEVDVFQGKLNFVKGQEESDTQVKIDKSWIGIVDDLFPFRINRFQVSSGEAWFRDFHAEPTVDVFIKDLQVVATNLTNNRKITDRLPARIKARGVTLGGGALAIDTRLQPMAKDPTFDLNAEIRDMDMTALNDLLKAYAKVDVHRGRFEVFTEIAAADGKFKGYVKPLFEDVNLLEIKQDNENPLKLAWEAIVAGVMKVFKNQPKDRFATKVPIEGEFGKPDVDLWTTIGNVFRNAFVKAFSPAVDESIALTEPREKQDSKRKN